MAYLVHHGIKGQKWGVRRFQNEDGTLTEAGKARYGNSTDYGKKAGVLKSATRDIATGRVARGITGSEYSTAGEHRAKKLQKKVDLYDYRSKNTITGKSTNSEKWANKAEKARSKLEAQKAKNANVNAYERHTSTGKLVAQNILMGHYGAQAYRNARAYGASRGKAIAESLMANSVVGYLALNRINKKRYGEAVHSIF